MEKLNRKLMILHGKLRQRRERWKIIHLDHYVSSRERGQQGDLFHLQEVGEGSPTPPDRALLVPEMFED
jgi:hypothetical protein